ncbi:hypothetical protein BH09PLA1_BH09PLA1_16230 [soil metagenome]
MNTRRRDRIMNALCCAVLAVAVTITFGRLFRADFTNWDDAHTIRENPDFKPPTLSKLLGLWSGPRAHLYVPVTYSVWWGISNATYRAQGVDFIQSPRGFHVVNIALHAAAACAVFALLRQSLLAMQFNLNRSRWCALAGAVIFALHPVQVEPVAWVSGLKDVLCGLLCALALWQYILYARSSTDDRGATTRRYILTCVLFIAAMLSKPTATMFPLMALAVDLFLLRRPMADLLRGILPLALFAIPGIIAAAYFQDAGGVTTLVPIQWRPFVAFDAITFYAAKLAMPMHLALDYGRHPQAVIHSGALRYAFLVPWLLLTIGIVARKLLPELIVGMLMFLAMLLPLLGLKPFDFQQYSTVADHYLYMPMIGAALIVAGLLARANWRLAIPIACLLCVALGVRTFDQTRHWMDSRALWTHTLEVNPDSWVSYLNLGEYFVTVDQPGHAEDLLRESINMHDNDPAHLNLGVIYLERGQLTDAAREFEQAIAIRPTSEAHTNLANAYGQSGRFEDAIREYEKALSFDPANEKAARMLTRTRDYVHGLKSRAATRAASTQRTPSGTD